MAQAQTQTVQIQIRSEKILGPIPVRIYLRAGFREKKKEGARLVRLQWNQPYSVRDLHVPTIKIDPSLKSGDVAVLEIWKERREWLSEERQIKAPEGSTRIIVKLYKPVNPETKPRAIFVVAEYYERSTRMGGRDESELLTKDGVLWSYIATNTSRSGNHGKRLYMLVSTKPVKIYWVSVSNRGNRRAGIDVYDYDNIKTLPELEELETIRSWSYGRVVRVRNNITGEVFTALVLEFHEARKTCARTTHEILPEDAVEPIESTVHSSKTHWTEIYRVLRPCRVKTIRVSNKGHEYVTEVDVQP